MLSVLVFLALIPLALVGAAILFTAIRWLLPYALAVLGGLVLWVAQQAGVKPDAVSSGSMVGGFLSVLGMIWIVLRWPK